MFAATRTNLDKARLYMLLHDDGCRNEAAELLKLTLREAGKRAYATVPDGPDELHDLVGALHHLSPSQQILEDWIEEAMKDPLDLASTVNLVANLLAGAPRGAESLAAYVGRTWDHHDLTQVCGLLSERAPAACDTVRRFLAARTDFKFLAEIIITWHQSPVLTKSTKDLLAAVVAREAGRGRRAAAQGGHRPDPGEPRGLPRARGVHQDAAYRSGDPYRGTHRRRDGRAPHLHREPPAASAGGAAHR